ncbi:MAG: tetratricopeptide repeat protein [Bacteroidota bacterium]
MAKNKKAKQGGKAPKAKKLHSKSRLNGQPDFFTNQLWHALIIMAFSFVLYGNTIGHGYTQDDAIVITDNMYTTQGLAGIPGILSYDTFKGFFKTEGKDKLVSGGRYRPMTLILFAIEWELSARPLLNSDGSQRRDAQGQGIKEGNPAVGHFVNVLLFGLTGLCVYWLLLALLTGSGKESYAYFVAIAAALLFVAHPIHTEAVANIKGRDEIVSLLGSLGAACLILRAFRTKQIQWSLLAGVVFFVGLMAKENAITFLAIVPLMYYFFTKADFGTIARQVIPFAAAAVAFLFIRFSIISSFGEPSNELMNNPFLKLEGSQYVPFSAAEQFATVLYTIGKYFQLLVFPHPLTHDYYPRHVDLMTLGDWQVWLSALAFLGLIAFSFWEMVKKNHLAFAGLFFLLTFSIVSNLLFPIGTNMAERLVFMPSVGFCMAVAILLYRLALWQAKSDSLKSFQQLNIPFAILGVVLLLMSIKTINRNAAWESNYTLFTTDIATSPNSAKLRNAVGGELSVRSLEVENEAQRKQMLTEAVGHLNEAVRIHPGYKEAYLQLGNCYNYLEQFDKAIQYYQQVLKMNPGDEKAERNIGITYRDAGRYWGEKRQDIQKAIINLQEARKRMPEDYETNRLLGVAFGVANQHMRAIEYFLKATEIQPENADAHWNLGSAFMHLGSNDKAQVAIEKAEQLDPGIRQRKQASERRMLESRGRQ